MDTHSVIWRSTIVLSLLLQLLLGSESRQDPYFDYYLDAGFGQDYSDYLSDFVGWGAGRHRRPGEATCVEIPQNMSLCRDIGYASMRLPNLLEHDTLDEVLQQSGEWNILANRQCHPDTKLFLCSLFSPVCLDQPIYPCRSLCRGVQAGCEHHMERYGYPWPEMLNCNKFPDDDGLCIGMISQQGGAAEQATCPACAQANTFEAIIDNYCRSDSVYRTKLRRETNGADSNEKVIHSGRKVRKMKGNNLTSQQRQQGLTMYLRHAAHCECGLAHDQSPDYIAMGNYTNGKFYVTAFHLYERNNDGLKRALRRIRRDRELCQKDFSVLLRENNPEQQQQPQRPEAAAQRRRSDDDNERNNNNNNNNNRRGNGRKKATPSAAEIDTRRIERQERRRQERLARKNAAPSAGDGGGELLPPAGGRDRSREARRNTKQQRQSRDERRDARERRKARTKVTARRQGQGRDKSARN